MLFSRKPQIIVEVQKPKYGKVIALTALAVAAAEAAAFVGLLIAKKITVDKIEKQPEDEGFDVAADTDELYVEFESEDEAITPDATENMSEAEADAE